jgi:hypothetical protein
VYASTAEEPPASVALTDGTVAKAVSKAIGVGVIEVATAAGPVKVGVIPDLILESAASTELASPEKCVCNGAMLSLEVG